VGERDEGSGGAGTEREKEDVFLEEKHGWRRRRRRRQWGRAARRRESKKYLRRRAAIAQNVIFPVSG
jgi:hypothetical protein